MEIQIGTKKYSCEVKDGVRYIDGKTVDEFLKMLPLDEVIKMAKVGTMALEDEIQGEIPPKGKYQYYSL